MQTAAPTAGEPFALASSSVLRVLVCRFQVAIAPSAKRCALRLCPHHNNLCLYVLPLNRTVAAPWLYLCRFVVDSVAGTFAWEDGDPEDEEEGSGGDPAAAAYASPTAAAPGGNAEAPDGGGGGAPAAAGGGLLTISVDLGPVGIKLSNDARGFATVLASSGQAEAKGVVAGHIIFAIGGNVLPRGTDHRRIGEIIKGLTRPFDMQFLPEEGDPEAVAMELEVKGPTCTLAHVR